MERNGIIMLTFLIYIAGSGAITCASKLSSVVKPPDTVLRQKQTTQYVNSQMHYENNLLHVYEYYSLKFNFIVHSC